MSTPLDVLAPAKLGPVTLRNRVIKAATFEARTPDALVTDDLIEYHRLPAAGGVGMTTVAYCAVSPGGRTEGNGIWMRPEAVPGFRRLTDAIHAEGAAVSAQRRSTLSHSSLLLVVRTRVLERSASGLSTVSSRCRSMTSVLSGAAAPGDGRLPIHETKQPTDEHDATPSRKGHGMESIRGGLRHRAFNRWRFI